MVLKHFAAPALVTLLGFLTIGCSSKEDQESYNKYYGKDRAVREEAALAAEAAKPKVEKVIEAAPTAPAVAKPDSAAATPAAPAEEKKAEVKEEAAKEGKAKGTPKEIEALLTKNTCFVCHDPNQRKVGPAFSEVAKKKYTPEQIVELVHNPKPEHWPGYPPMAPMGHVPKDEIIKIAKWINSL